MAEKEDSIIYLEHDAEITEAIAKLKKAEADTVRIVVPPRSPLLQSVVNLKLLKKAATSKKKELVLVTGDKAATNLAGKVGIPVAKNVKAEAVVPDAEPEPKAGKVAAAAATAAVLTSPLAADAAEEEASKARDEELPVQRFDEPADTGKKSKKSKKSKSSGRGKVPNYTKFQKWIWIGASAVGVILLIWLLSAFVQTATVNVQAAADRRDVNTQFTLVTAGTTSGTTVAAQTLEISKDLSQSVEATGEKDVGAKATGTVALKNCEDSNARTLAAGTKVTTSGKTFVTNAAATLPEGEFSGGGTVCNSKSVSVAITAAANGDEYNFSNASFTVVGLSSRISGTGTTSGGVSKTIKVVSQADVDAAVKALLEGSKAEALTELKQEAGEDQKVFDDTLTATATTQSSNPPVGTEASNATVNVKAKYTVLAASEEDLTQVVETALSSDLKGGSKVLDAGLDQAKLTPKGQNKTGFSYAMATVAYIGQPIDAEALKKEVAGKAKKEVPDIAKQYPNVTGATVDGWPLVPNMPIPTGNIKVEISVTK
ncbi:MAG: hypothetical protein QG658_21 [Patescibacteria group bacterium]|jgi:hypothetical protein|nr:hypothetical protein [Patescibacteria group bacterium]